MGRRTIYRERTAPSTAVIDEFNGSSSSRTIVAGETLTLSFKFPRTASTSLADYGLSIEFANGLSFTL